jgi:very-short-patch-repair endonuclease
MTDAEKLLWYQLRRRHLGKHRFRRQVPLGPYILDFVCLESKVVVEVDGSQHLDSVRDRTRDLWLEGEGYLVLRFWNHDVLARTQIVLKAIVEALDARAPNCPHPASGHLPPQAGEGIAEALRAREGSAEALRAREGNAEALRAGEGNAEALRAGEGNAEALRAGQGNAEALRAGQENAEVQS